MSAQLNDVSFTLKPQQSQSKLTTSTKVKLDMDKKLIIHRIINELSKEPSGDIYTVLQKPHIQKIFKQDFNLNESEIKNLEGQIVQNCEDIMTSVLNQQTKRDTQGSNEQRKSIIQKVQPLTMLQRKEIDRYQELDYNQYPVQPCVRSLYYISRIAQTQSIKIIVPPTILIGFGDDNRMMFNDQQRGTLIVQSGYISPKIINNFLNKHMTAEHLEQSIENRLIFPKFVIKLAQKTSNKNEIKLYYNRETLIADLMNYWGTYDMAIQIFIKQKHLRPSLYRYYMKNGNVYKAVAISNSENMTKSTKLHQSMMTLIQEQFQRTKKTLQNKNGSNKNTQFKRRDHIKPQQVEQVIKTFVGQKQAATTIEDEDYILDNKGFPVTLELFRINDYYTELSSTISNNEFKKYFTCSSENMENLSMMNCRPGAQVQAEKMTLDLYRLFSQYYLKIKRFGNVSQFVCDFMEAENGLMYLLQVKSFDCEGVIHDWQVPFSPQKQGIHSSPGSADKQQDEDPTSIPILCQAKIICDESKPFDSIRELFIQALKSQEMWVFPQKKGQLPKFSCKVISKFHKEVDLGKESFLLQSEKTKIAPLFPLTTFCEQLRNNQQSSSPKRSRQNSRFSSIMNKQPPEVQEQSDEPQPEAQCCWVCYKVLELFTSRYYALVFKTEQTVEELRKLKLKLVNQWTLDNMLYLVKIYKNSKRSLYIVSDIEKFEKKNVQRELRERARTPDSVTRRTIRNQVECQEKSFANGKQEVNNSRNGMNTSRTRPKRLIVSKSLQKSIDQVAHTISDKLASNPHFKQPSLPLSSRDLFNKRVNHYTNGSQSSKFKRSHSFQSQKLAKEIYDYRMKQQAQHIVQISNLVKPATVDYNQDDPYQDMERQLSTEEGFITPLSINDKELHSVMSKFNIQINQDEQSSLNKSQGSAYNIPQGVKSRIGTNHKYFLNALGVNNADQLSNKGFFNSRKQSGMDRNVNAYFNQKRQLSYNEKKLQLSHRVKQMKSSGSNEDLMIDIKYEK